MSNSAAISATALFAQDFTGARALRKPGEEAGTVSLSSDWSFGYEELFRPVCHGTGAIFGSIAYHHSSPSFFQKVVDALPIAPHETPSEFMSSLQAIERCLSGSASDVAKMLRVSRQMVYHYRAGMQPAVDNFRRMQHIANIVNHVTCDMSLESIIKLPQPEGKSLLAYLSEEKPDTQLVQRIIVRANTDLRKRITLAEMVGYATPHDRRDVMRERHAVGKPIYVSDPSTPEGLIQIRPDQSRVRGRMVNRVFVPNEG